MAYFFATPEDLLPVLLAVEEKIGIKYTPCGHFDTADVPSFASARELPTLFLEAPEESSVACPSYLVSLREATVHSRRIARSNGTTVWAIDQLENDASTVLNHGGRLGDEVLLQGRVLSVHKDPVAQKLQRSFDAEIRKAFAKIQAFRVGKGAEALLDAGVRLTAASQSPRELDLKRPTG